MGFTEHHYPTQDGLSLYYRCYGSGDEVVICLPGLTRNSKDFHEIATHLSTRYRVLSLDIRGRGQSEWDTDWRNYHPATYINDTWSLLDQLEISNFIMIGTSLGGLLSMIMAYQQPKRVRAVILNDAGPEADPAGYTRILASFDQQTVVNDWQEAIRQCKRTYEAALPDMPMDFWSEFVRKNHREGEDGQPELDIDPKIGEAIRKGDLSRIAGIQVDPWAAFNAVTMPCLVLRGELSDILSPEIVERMTLVKPDLINAVIPDRGHAPLLNEPESLLAVDTFLQRLSSG
ncbi:MAG: alpha/beta hydrolase [Xanthomonadales bacterium]|nr:alpha/beta hydrolase [Xanthomonadales bacterium]MDH4020148.1 alpha/beta hydrolase [Xanthomonadales bacterium]